MRPFILTVVGAAVLATGLTACAATGPRSAQERDVEDVVAVRLETSGTLTVERGDEASLTVTAAEDVLPRLTSEVEDGVLVLGVEPSALLGGLGTVEYGLVLPRLDAVTVTGSGDVVAADVTGALVDVVVEGSGDVDLAGLDAAEVRTTVDGSGDVHLDGSATRQSVSVDGSGSYEAGALRSEEAVVALRGSGGVDLVVTGTLTATVEGSGTVSHSGGADVTSDVAGSGAVVER